MTVLRSELTHPFACEQTLHQTAGDVPRIYRLSFTSQNHFHKHLAETHVSPADLNNSAPILAASNRNNREADHETQA